MGLLDGLIAAYQGGMGLLAPNERDVEMRPQIAKGLLGILPGSGDAISGYDAVQSAMQGKYGEAALNGVGLLPFIPAMGGMIKTATGRIPETYSETSKLADMLERAGNAKGYDVSRSDSAISPSRYVTFYKTNPETLERVNEAQVRLSNHADKYPELANGTRVSVDPSMMGTTFEDAVKWLADIGYPTALSTRFRNAEKSAEAARQAAELERRRLIQQAHEQARANFTPELGDYSFDKIIVGGKNNRQRVYAVNTRDGNVGRVFAKDVPDAVKTNPDRSVLNQYLLDTLGLK